MTDHNFEVTDFDWTTELTCTKCRLVVESLCGIMVPVINGKKRFDDSLPECEASK